MRLRHERARGAEGANQTCGSQASGTMGKEVLSKVKSPEEILEAAGFEFLDKQTPSKSLEGMLRSLAEMAPGFDEISKVGVHQELVCQVVVQSETVSVEPLKWRMRR